MKTVVIQSAGPRQQDGWLRTCMTSVNAWAEGCGFSYTFFGDEIFDTLPDEVMKKYHDQPVVRSVWRGS